ncbi:MAG: Light-sensor Protein kinase [Peltula sp. TS41687]|nr:MAG: Light-sensor Protein kinase [Peltula sp. TS41687]
MATDPDPSNLPTAPKSLDFSSWTSESNPRQALSAVADSAHVDGHRAVSREHESPISPGSLDRVFPIRSVVSVDPTPKLSRSNTGSGFPGMNSSSMSRLSSWHSDLGRHTGKSSLSSAQGEQVSDAAVKTKGKFSSESTSVRSGSVSRSPRSAAREAESVNSAMQDICSATDSISTKSESVGGSAAVSREGSLRENSFMKTGAVQDVGTTGGGEVITARFKHIVTAEGHAVITGRDGETLQRCEDEPIHIPGAIQGFGVLIALREESEGKFVVRVVSENSEQIIGYSPGALFRLENFCDLLSRDQSDNFLDHIDFIRDGESDPAVNGPEVFIVSLRSRGRRSVKLWCAIHINDRNKDLIICELELDDDQLNPLTPARSTSPDEPEDTLKSDPTAEELAESTSNTSKPLRVLRSARKRKGEAAAMEVFNIMSQVQEQLASAPNLDSFLKVLVGVIKELTGFHRVMIYQFDQSWNGRVVTELVDPRTTKDLYKGLNFPASDIPKQARDLYKLNKVRLLYDRDQPTARLVCRDTEDLETPLDLTYSYLRAMSPIHIKYLANMAVRASMSISINAFDELWGLIACHAYGAKGMRVSFPIRKMCRLVGDSASRNIERLSYASRLQARKLINTVPTEHNPSGYILASSEDLLQLFDADFGLLAIRNETKIMGKVEQTQEALAMLEYLRLRQITSVLASQDVREDFPDLRYPPGFRVIAGLLLVPLTAGGEDFIVFFRKSQLKEVRWAGNPYEKFTREGTEGYLEPRKSFRTWTETVVGRCKEWTEEQIETAAVLCLVYGKFISVWRRKEAALQSSQLTQLLLANSAHEVRTPLNAIINYLEIALEGNIDRDTREYLAKSHSASKSLICVINDLLDLTKTEEGQELIRAEEFDLPATVREAVDMFAGEAKRKQIRLEVHQCPRLPRVVLGDQRRVRQAISNITANAIQHTSQGFIRVELSVVSQSEGRVDVDIIIEDSGSGMSAKQLDAIFRQLEQVQAEDDEMAVSGAEFFAINRITSGPLADKEKGTLGLGLAVVARVIKNMDGQLRLKSEAGKGSRFVIQLPFFLPPGKRQSAAVDRAPTPTHQPAAPSTPNPPQGEFVLVNHTSPNPKSSRPPSMRRHGSTESAHSLVSMKSQSSARSHRSDMDQLIDAIQEPHQIGKRQSLEYSGSPMRKQSGDQATPSRQQDRRLRTQSLTGRMSPVKHTHSPTRSVAGMESVADSGTPIRPVKVHDGASPTSTQHTIFSSSQLLENIGKPRSRPGSGHGPSQLHDRLSILVAEDDPINTKIMGKRLEKFGYRATFTVNGEECASVYGENAANFDAILMDMQAS